VAALIAGIASTQTTRPITRPALEVRTCRDCGPVAGVSFATGPATD